MTPEIRFSLGLERRSTAKFAMLEKRQIGTPGVHMSITRGQCMHLDTAAAADAIQVFWT